LNQNASHSTGCRTVFQTAPNADVLRGEALIFRHSALRTQFGDRHPQGQDADVEALPEYEEWVLKEWEQFRDAAEE
jgi:hypothetical protein